MDVSEINRSLAAFSKSVGPKAWVSLSIDDHVSESPISLSVYPEGICATCAMRVTANSWEELFHLAVEQWAIRKVDFEDRISREMALEVIRITVQFGACTDAALRGDKYTAAQVTLYGARAVILANEMAATGPFEIVAADARNSP